MEIGLIKDFMSIFFVILMYKFIFGTIFLSTKQSAIEEIRFQIMNNPPKNFNKKSKKTI